MRLLNKTIIEIDNRAERNINALGFKSGAERTLLSLGLEASKTSTKTLVRGISKSREKRMIRDIFIKDNISGIIIVAMDRAGNIVSTNPKSMTNDIQKITLEAAHKSTRTEKCVYIRKGLENIK